MWVINLVTSKTLKLIATSNYTSTSTSSNY